MTNRFWLYEDSVSWVLGFEENLVDFVITYVMDFDYFRSILN